MNRNYNQEIKNNNDRNYFYGFDIDIMHPFMYESFEKYFVPGDILELGSYDGSFTSHLLNRFCHVDCIEASSVAAEKAITRHGSSVNVLISSFEEASLDKKYENIVLTHVLEHLDEPVGILKRIKKDWLAPNGRIFVVVPNANAPSRQIAVRMGLIDNNSSVTEGEEKHGHRITYSQDTLYHHIRSSGLKVASMEGIFFKALANFQWDKILKTDIISSDYIRGCYEFGKIYPDLCASLFALCESY